MSKIRTLAIASSLLMFFVFSIVPLVLANPVDARMPNHVFNLGFTLMIYGGFSVSAAVFAALIAWLTARRRTQIRTVH